MNLKFIFMYTQFSSISLNTQMWQQSLFLPPRGLLCWAVQSKVFSLGFISTLHNWERKLQPRVPLITSAIHVNNKIFLRLVKMT